MEAAVRSKVLVLLALTLASGCSSNRNEDPSMGTDPAKKGTGLESDPYFYKLNSVTGRVMAGGKPVKGAAITIVRANEKVPIEADGVYVLVLDPARFKSDTHELVFSAPGYVEQRITVTIPANNQVRVDVELEPAGK
jgi:hypothetical protein